VGVSRAAQIFKVPPIISGTGKATDFKFGRYIQRVLHPNKSPLKILEKRERRRIQGLPNVFIPGIISGTGKATNFKLCIALSYDRSQQKPINNIGKSSRGRSQGFRNFFLASIYRAHDAVIFAIAGLSCAFLLQKSTPVARNRDQRNANGPIGVDRVYVMLVVISCNFSVGS